MLELMRYSLKNVELFFKFNELWHFYEYVFGGIQ
jgi:hypothetical protein